MDSRLLFRTAHPLNPDALPLVRPIRAVFLSLLLLGFSASAIGVTLSGKITSSGDNSPVVEANVLVEELDLKARADLDGRYQIEIEKAAKYRLQITHVSFDTKVLDIELGERDTLLNVELSPRTYIYDEVVVTGTRTPYLLKDVPVTTEVIRTEDAIQTGATTVDQALKSAVGINVDNNFSGSGASLRGLDPTRVLILIDGEKMVGRVRGAIDLAQISLANVEKIEVVKGVGSTLYGSDAIGGVVNIITRKPQAQLRLNSAGEYGTYNAYMQNLELESKRGNWGLQVGARFDRTDGFDLDKSTPHTNGMERIKRFNLDGKVTRRISKAFDLTVNGNFFRERKNWIESEYIDPITFTFDDEENNYRYSAGSKIAFQPNPRTLVDVNLYGTYYDHLWEKFTASGTLSDKSRTEDYLGEASVSATHSYKEGHVVTMGGDFVAQSLESEEIEDGKQEVSSGDLYMQYEWKPVENLTMLPGIRLEEHSTFGEHVNASINVMYNPHPRFRIRGFHGGGFRAPSIKELYFRFDHSAAGYIVIGGGEDLRPEKSRNSSLSLEYSYEGIGLHRITYFYNDINDMIEFNLTGFSPTYWRGIYKYQNVFKAYTRGIEWQSELKINHHVDFSVSYTWLTAKNRETGHWLLNRPEHALKLLSSIHFDDIGLVVTAWGSWYSGKLWVPLGEQNDFESDVWAPTRRDLNLSVSKRVWENLEVFARGENLTDDVEIEFGYWPGRTFHAGLRWNSR